MSDRLLGISRSPRFSPHSTERDRAIFSAVATLLSQDGLQVDQIGEDVFAAEGLSRYSLVFSMARGMSVLEALASAEAELHLPVVNSAQQLLQMDRAKIVQTFERHHVPQPPFRLLSPVSQQVMTSAMLLPFPFWLKRADACAQQPGDVRFISDEAAWQAAWADFTERQVQRAVISAHMEGDLIKFYGVEGTDFFHTSCATEKNSFSKFGLEAHNGAPHHYAFDVAALKAIADRAARATGLLIYGGDAVVAPNGTFSIIDFNDWPSFSACKDAAATAIARRIKQLIPSNNVR